MKENWVNRTGKKRMRWRWEIRTRIRRKKLGEWNREERDEDEVEE